MGIEKGLSGEVDSFCHCDFLDCFGYLGQPLSRSSPWTTTEFFRKNFTEVGGDHGTGCGHNVGDGCTRE